MRKKIALFLAVCTAAASLAACAGESTPVGGSAPAAQSQQSITGESAPASSTEGETTSETGEGSTMTGEASAPSSSESGDSQTSGGSESDGASAAQSSKTESSKSESSAQTSKSESDSSRSESSAQTSKPSQTSTQQSSKPSQTSTQQTSKPTQTSTQQSSKPAQTSTQQSSKPAQTSTQQSSKPAQSSTQQPSQTPASSSEYDIGGKALYNELFSLDNRVTVDIQIDKHQIDLLQQDYKKYYGRDENTKSSIYRMATVTFTVNSKKYTVEQVGIRLKGNQSLRPFYDSNGKPNICSFKLSFDEAFDDKSEYGSEALKWSDADRKARKKRKFATMNELDIKYNVCYDYTNIREVYATELFKSEKLLVQNIGLSQMKINGNNYGVVKIYETIDKTFLEKRLPPEAIGGDLYKCMWADTNNAGARTGNWKGATMQLNNSYGIQDNENGKKFNFNLKTNKKDSKNASLKNLLSVINKSNVTKAELEKVVDIDYWAKFMAATYFAGGPDDIRNNYNNFYVYFRKDNGKAVFIVYDNDRTLGITIGLNKNTATRNPYSSYAASQGDQQNPLIKNTVSHNVPASLKYIRDDLYASALKKIAESKWMKNSDEFNKMYNKAKNNYESVVVPYTTFANQKYSYKFSLEGNKNGADNQNMSFENYRSQIIDAYKNAKP